MTKEERDERDEIIKGYLSYVESEISKNTGADINDIAICHYIYEQKALYKAILSGIFEYYLESESITEMIPWTEEEMGPGPVGTMVQNTTNQHYIFNTIDIEQWNLAAIRDEKINEILK